MTSAPSIHAGRQRILLVDDHLPWTSALNEVIHHLDPERFEVHCAHSGHEGLSSMRRETFDLVFLDLNMGDANGIEVLRSAREDNLAHNYVLMSAEDKVRNAVEALQQGASDFLVKPFGMEQVRGVLDRLLPKPSASANGADPRTAWRDEFAPGIIGNHPALLDVLLIIERIAKTTATVLITGEAGTGKELFARAVHNASDRASGPMVPINVTATGESLFESSLFGWAKGAFTGATTDRAGFFEEANKGTIFLDEIGELAIHQQPKLLRVLQSKTFNRIGEIKERQTDARVVAATNQNLVERVSEGKFREDLYWRINEIPITLPPLRERASDIPILAEHFLRRASKTQSRPKLELSPEAQAWLASQRWRGNIRELEHSINRVCLLHRDGILLQVPDLERYLRFEFGPPVQSPTVAQVPVSFERPEPSAAPAAKTQADRGADLSDPSPTLHTEADLLQRVSLPSEGLNLKRLQQSIEAKLIWQALVEKKFVRAHAAGVLGVGRTTLVEKIRKLSSEFPRLTQEDPSPGDQAVRFADLRSPPPGKES